MSKESYKDSHNIDGRVASQTLRPPWRPLVTTREYICCHCQAESMHPDHDPTCMQMDDCVRLLRRIRLWLRNR